VLTLGPTCNASLSVSQTLTFTLQFSSNSTLNGPAELIRTALYTDPSLVAYYRFEGNSNDSSPNGHNLSDTGSPTYSLANGRFYQGVLYNGGNQFSSGSDSGFPSGNSDRTWVGWLNFKAFTNSGGIFAYGSSSIHDGVGLIINTDGSLIIGGYADDANFRTDLSLNTWYHVAWTLSNSGSTITLYLNGVPFGSPSTGHAWNSILGGAIYLGYQPFNGLYSNVAMDDVAIFSRVLSQSEVASLFWGGTPSTGTINVVPSGYRVNLSCQLNGSNIAAPATLTDMPAGKYTLSCTAPAGYTISSISPSASQTLSAGGSINFDFTISPPSGTPPPAVWPMSGHDSQRTGLSTFIGSSILPRGGQLVFDPGAAIVGDLTISAEGNVYFATSTALYALTPAGSAYVSPLAVTAVTGPAIDDQNGYVYIGLQNGVSGWNVVRYTKQLQQATVVYSATTAPSPLIIGNNGALYFFVGGTALARGPIQWNSAVCGAFIGAPAIGENGDVYGMCGDGIYRVDGNTGLSAIQSSYSGEYEPMIDAAGNLYSGYEGFQFSGATYAFWGDYSTWDSNLNHIASNSSDYTTSRASLAPDGTSTVRLGDGSYDGSNALRFRGSTSWDLYSYSFTGATAFTSIPSVDAAGKVFVGMSNSLVCINAADHTTVYQMTMSEPVVTQPVIAGTGTVYVATSSGKIFSF
jgi:hypothetical protein